MMPQDPDLPSPDDENPFPSIRRSLCTPEATNPATNIERKTPNKGGNRNDNVDGYLIV